MIRKKYVSLTPEEWVRQNFIQFLISEKNYPSSLMAVETLVMVNNNPQRTDLMIYDRTGGPLVIAEFKSPEVKITQQTFDQIVRYNMPLRVKILMVSNGISHYCCSINYTENQTTFFQDIPDYQSIL
jgi:type I site-specific restriction-modification system R (restriction) subunit